MEEEIFLESNNSILNQLHSMLYGESHDYGNIDIGPYVQEAEQIFNQNPVFKKLSGQFSLSDLSVGSEQITEVDIATKYIYLYIFLELIYQKVRSDPAEKDKLYDRINHLGPDNNFFGYLKIYTVYYSTKFTRMLDHWFPLRFFSSSFLMLNIFEAVIEDLTKWQFTNASVGLYLMLSTPFSVRNFRKDLDDNIICDFDDKWINLYTSWNTLFTYSDSPGVNYFPRTSICLFNSFKHKSEWLNNRAYVLFASHILKSDPKFNAIFGLNDKPNPTVLAAWNKENVRYMFGMLDKQDIN